MKARVELDAGALEVDLARPVSLAVELDFAGPQPRHFNAPRASSRPFAVPGFAGSVADGASCNCEVLSLIPHCNGTHTECVGHLTRERLDAWRVVPVQPLPAVVLSVSPQSAGAARESTDLAPQLHDLLITRETLARAWPERAPFAALALALRTLPNGPDKRTRDYSDGTAPYLTRAAAEWLVARGILHLIVDLPSIDRAHDQGRLTAHRIFFGLPPGSTHLADAARPGATVTELAFIPEAVKDGAYLCQLQVPAIGGDAVPSRPLLYPLAASTRAA
ncbi:MAG: cyclase family protein [Steroidobacteraceae bacterium]